MKKFVYYIWSLAILFVPLTALAHAGEDDYYQHMDGFGMMGGSFTAFGWIGMVLFWVFLVLGSIAFWRYINKNNK